MKPPPFRENLVVGFAGAFVCLLVGLVFAWRDAGTDRATSALLFGGGAAALFVTCAFVDDWFDRRRARPPQELK